MSSDRDATALIGLTAVLEAHLLGDDLDPHLVGHLVRWMRSAGVLAAGDGPPELRLLLANVNQRLRFAAGEYDREPPVDTGAVDQLFGFPARSAALAFAGAVREPAVEPVEVDGRAYDGEVRWEVAVRTTELPLSPAFDAHVHRLCELAAEHGGSYGGWSGVAGGISPR